jgi:PRTRC genetic system ThiF family protein
MNKHLFALARELSNRPLRVWVIGCGGTGSRILEGLTSIHTALVALGRTGLSVTAFDDDRVSPHNLGRQSFYAADIGQYKSEVLINRINFCFGTDWKAKTTRLSSESGKDARNFPDLIIGCVDTIKSRQVIHQVIESSRRANVYSRPEGVYWLDCGNRSHDGQVVLGCFNPRRDDRLLDLKSHKGLPLVTEMYPELLDEGVKEVDAPSCSMREALTKQSLFINRAVATSANALLSALLMDGYIHYCQCFINLKTGQQTTVKINSAQWERMGLKPIANLELEQA